MDDQTNFAAADTAAAPTGERPIEKTGTTLAPVGLTFERRFTTAGTHPFDEVTWEKRDSVIGNEKGATVFEQKDVEVPSFWSQMATNVVVSKYFRGPQGTPRRETSVRQVIGRVCDTIAKWGRDGGYFRSDDDAMAFNDELTHLVLHQKMAFNSPVWFNIGVPGTKPQASACFINSVEDTMDSILKLAHTEGMLFKYGSGTGTNLSPIRSSAESLAGGGTASGPVSFMKGFDAFAGVIKSGGTTRRAAKMVVLNADHPDVEEFITCKVSEERKAWALIDAGYDGSFTGEAYTSIFFQNSNNSVRVSDDFMRAVIEDKEWQLKAVTNSDWIIKTVRAREMLRLMAESAHHSGDPGIQYDTTINDWHTSSNTARINASNPCSEFVFLDDTACNLASLNLLHFLKGDGTVDVDAYKHAIDVTITAQEILVSSASYPTPRIAENSENFRPLGLGYANLGAMLMARGLPYDSPEGRDMAGCMTAIMTGEGYTQSARIAREVGPFAGYATNRQPMLRVIGKHREAAYNIGTERVEAPLITAARKCWDEAHELGAVHGYRNAQVTVLAPTGCLVGDTLLMTSGGLVRLRGLGDSDGAQWQNLDIEVATDEGPRAASQFFVNGAEPVVTVETSHGYQIQGTALHRIKVVAADGTWEWRRLADVRAGERVPMMIGGMVGEPNAVLLPPLPDALWKRESQHRAPRYLTAGLAELLGFFMGAGSGHARGLRFSVSDGDTDVVARLTGLARTLFGIDALCTENAGGGTEVAVDSARLTLWWEACGFTGHRIGGTVRQGAGIHVPDAVLTTNNRDVYAAFVRGLFEADGTVSSGYPSLTTTAETLSREVQTILLALGFVATRTIGVSHGGAPSPGGSTPETFGLRLLNVATAGSFADQVGFIGVRKSALCRAAEHDQAARRDRVPVTRRMIEALSPENDDLRRSMLPAPGLTATGSRPAATQLLERTVHPELGHSLYFFDDEVRTAELGEEQFTYDISVPTNHTYVANGFIGHNTIGFMMDCDTTGVEPDIALVKYKKLVGGGMLKIVNQTVPMALRRMGYGESAVTEIIDHIDKNDTIEGAPHIRDEDVAVFDCAFKPANGERSIAWQGHVRMMAAAQPFLSGAISKTVNMPEDATVEDVEKAYIDGWQLGLKALAIYRDGSKRSQPMATSMDKTTGSRVQVIERPLRRKLPSERQAITHRFEVGGHEGYITVGLYEDGQPGEIFLKMAKEGSTVSGMMDSFAVAVSMALQYGVPLTSLVDKLSHTRFDPQGFTKNPEIPIAKSVMDYVFRWLGSRFLDWEDRDKLGILRRDGSEIGEPPLIDTRVRLLGAEAAFGAAVDDIVKGAAPNVSVKLPIADPGVKNETSTFQNQGDAPSCSDCGSLMVRSGACYKCHNCGATSGCS